MVIPFRIQRIIESEAFFVISRNKCSPRAARKAIRRHAHAGYFPFVSFRNAPRLPCNDRSSVCKFEKRWLICLEEIPVLRAESSESTPRITHRILSSDRLGRPTRQGPGTIARRVLHAIFLVFVFALAGSRSRFNVVEHVKEPVYV